MGQELKIRENDFFETNVKGWWEHQALFCSKNLYCSSKIFVRKYIERNPENE